MRSPDAGSRSILGIDLLPTTAPALVARIDDAIDARAPLRLAFLNAHLANIASADPELAAKLRSFVVVNDGIGTDIASRLLYGHPFPQNLNGTDFTPFYLETSRHRLRIFLLGSRPAVVNKAAKVLEEQWPQHSVVGAQGGYFGREREHALAKEIQGARPDLILVGMGNPRQELWIADYIPRVASCAFAIGALFDFVTGEARRAPQWVRRIRCEWVFRLVLEPRRLWRRYLVGNAVFLVRVLAQRLRDER